MSERRYIYGRHPVGEILRARPTDVHRLFVTGMPSDVGSHAQAGRSGRLADLVTAASRHAIPVVEADKRMLEKLVGAVPHQGIVAEIAPFDFVDLSRMLELARASGLPPLLVALDHIQDPHNLGALIRSSLALGAHGLIIPKDRSCGITPAVVKASAGATARLPLARVTNLRRTLEDAKGVGLWVVGAAAEAEGILWQHDFTQPTILVIGSEGRGLRRTVRAACDHIVRIPLVGDLASLNASVAGGICLYEAASQRLQGTR